MILWAFFLAGGYIWAHNPLTVDALRGLGGTLASITVWLGVTWLGAALGHRVITRRLAEEGDLGRRPPVHLALAAATGLGVISLLVWGLGMAGLFYPWAAWLLMLVLAVFLRRDLRQTLGIARRVRLPSPETALQTWFLIYCVAVLLLALFISLAPPTAFDSLVYHLRGPELYIEAGAIGHPVDIPHLGFPQLGQMQFALGMLLWGDGATALFHFGYALMAVVVTAALTSAAYGREAAWFSVAILLSVPTIFSLMSWAYVDITLLLYATAAFYAFYQWRARHAQGEAGTAWLVAIGLFSGFAGGVKYTAVLIPVALGISILWVSRRDGLPAVVRRLALVALPAGVVVVPWVVENWLTTGNPVYPFFLDEARYWDEWRAWWYDRPGTGLAATAPWRLLIVPVEATILGTEGTEFYEATLGPLLLIGGGLLAAIWSTLKREEKGIAAHMLFFFLLNYLLWLNGVARTRLLLRARFIIFVFGVVSAFGGLALARLPALRRPQLAVDWLVRAVVAGTLALTLFAHLTTFLEINPLPVIVGLETRDAYLIRRLGLQQVTLDGINQLPADSRVLFLWAARSYGCEVECWPDALLDRFLHYTHYYGYNADEIAERWQERGFTHVFLYQAGLDFLLEAGREPITEADLAILEALQAEHLREVGRWQDAYYLYELDQE